MVKPVSGGRVWLAGAVDQFALISFLAFWLAGALQFPQYDVAFIVIGIVGMIVCGLVEGWVAYRRGTTIGLFVLGLRTNPAARWDYGDALEWFVEFWQNTLLIPFAWLFRRLAGDEEIEPILVRDPRAVTGVGRCVRSLLVVLIATPWVLIVVSVLA